LLQPGLVKEMVVADILGHEVSREKHQPDAFDPNDSTIQYEYLSCFEKGTFQMDRMYKSLDSERRRSLRRISRNKAIYCIIFEKGNPTCVVAIWEITPKAMLAEAKRKLDKSKNDISHISFGRKWVRENGTQVYSKDS
ncbi:MAG TPA: hypothetical protein PK992_06670, partial [Planctomycetaceae bacterium]|nr:hypothetical protein [Planctomycetaceae bacterium]